MEIKYLKGMVENKEKQIKVLDKIHARKRAQKQTEKYEQAHYDARNQITELDLQHAFYEGTFVRHSH